MTDLVLKLAIAGRTPRTEHAVANIEEICASGDLQENYQLVVIDVLERPQLAENERILATPMLVKELPPPLRRVVGDMSDRESVVVGLDLAVRKGIENEGGNEYGAGRHCRRIDFEPFSRL